MTVLVTGSSGLVGASLVEYLLDNNYEVIGYDQSKPSAPLNGCIYERGDLCDFPHLASVIQKHTVESIVHCGGISHPYAGTGSPYQVVQTNIIGTINIFEAAKLYRLKKVVYMSSGAVYGNNTSQSIEEEHSLNPTTMYGVSKLTGEQLANVYVTNNDLDITSLRLAFVYGPGRHMPDPIKSLLERAVKGESIQDKQGADQKLEFIYVKDVVKAIDAALNSYLLSSNVFNIGSGVNTTVRNVGSILQDIFPNLSINIGPGDLGYDFMGPFNCVRAKKELNFETKYSLKEGILDYMDSMMKSNQ